MMDYFKPYEGEKPFFFVSYSHRDSDFVLDTISLLRQQAYRLWYDEGIPAGGDWPKNIEEHMRLCDSVLCFLSATALASPNCYNEIREAHDRSKAVYCIRLDDAVPDTAWKAALEGAVYLDTALNAQAAAAAFAAFPGMEQRFRGTEADYSVQRGSAKRRGGLDWMLAALLLAAIGLGTAVFAQSRLTVPQQPVQQVSSPEQIQKAPVDLGEWKEMLQSYLSFPDSQQESAIRNRLGVYEGKIESERLAEITQLYFCGSASVRTLEGIVYNGGWSVNGSPVLAGGVRDLSLIGKMVFLEELALIDQPVKDLSQLEKLPRLRFLSLAGCRNAALSTLPTLPALETLCLEHSGVRDLTGLSSFPNLKTVQVSIDQFPLNLEKDAPYDVVLVK